MTRFAPAAAALVLALTAGGCFSLENKTDLSVPPAKLDAARTVAEQKKDELKNKRRASSSLPDTLGGVVSSDRWVIYQDKQEEEFDGNVHYDNGVYAFRADHALSQRKQNLFTARGSVFLSKNEPDGSRYEIYADKAVYNYQTGKGRAEASAGKRIKLIYTTKKSGQVTALARRAEFDTKQGTYLLSGKTFVTHYDAAGQKATLQADRIFARQGDRYVLLQGQAEVQNADYHLSAQTIEYDGAKQQSYAYGGRPLTRGKTEDGTFAIIADKVTAENDTRKIRLEGRVQGWTVSEQINSSEANKKF